MYAKLWKEKVDIVINTNYESQIIWQITSKNKLTNVLNNLFLQLTQINN